MAQRHKLCLKLAPTPKAYGSEWDMAILMPSGDLAPLVCSALLKLGRPFACMVPSDLVPWIPIAPTQKLPTSADPVVVERLESSVKIVSLASGMPG